MLQSPHQWQWSCQLLPLPMSLHSHFFFLFFFLSSFLYSLPSSLHFYLFSSSSFSSFSSSSSPWVVVTRCSSSFLFRVELRANNNVSCQRKTKQGQRWEFLAFHINVQGGSPSLPSQMVSMDNTSPGIWSFQLFLAMVAHLQMTMSRTTMQLIGLQPQLVMVVVVDLTITIACCQQRW